MRWDRTTDEPRRVGSGRSLVTHVVRHSLPTLLPLPPPTPLLPSPTRTHTHPTPWPFPRYACDRFAPAYGVNEWRKIGRRNHVISRNFRSRFVPFALRLSSTHSTYR